MNNQTESTFEHQLAQSDDLTLDIIVGTGSSLSIIGSASIIITTLVFSKLQKHCFSLRLILFISLCDLIISASFLTGILSKETGWWPQQSKKDPVCIIQAAVLQYFAVASFLWMACFAHCLWRSVRRTAYNQLKERKQMRRYEIIYHTICWILPFVPLPILGPLGLFGPTGNWCWISDETMSGDVSRFLCFYFPLWVIMFFIFVVYIVVIRRSRDHVVIRRVSLYILVFILLYIPATADRVINWIEHGRGWYWLHLLHALTQSLQGFLNCIVYGFSLNVIREAIKKLVIPIWSKNEESLLKIDNSNTTNSDSDSFVSSYSSSSSSSLSSSSSSISSSGGFLSTHNNNNNHNRGDGGDGMLGPILIDEADFADPIFRSHAIN